MSTPNRRRVLAGAASLVAGAVAPVRALAIPAVTVPDPSGLYVAVTTEPFPVPAINLKRVGRKFLRAAVDYDTTLPAGTIVVDPAAHYLYLIDGNGGAIRYGVGVGRQGFAWNGNATIRFKREWPDWYPPKEMLARDGHLMKFMDKLQSGIGMHGGPGNPLGARAMYLWQDNKDTLFRIHGTVEPWSIGTNASSGCIRMINQDVMDLYGRVALNTQVMVLGPADRRPRIIEANRPLPDPVPTNRQMDVQQAGNGAPNPDATLQQQTSMQQPTVQQVDAPAYQAADTMEPGATDYDPYDPYGFDKRGHGPTRGETGFWGNRP